LPPRLTYFDPQPAPGDLPARLPSPFDPAAPHPLARRAAAELMERLQQGWPRRFGAEDRGKMFGVLVVIAPDGRIGYLRAFSGMLDDRWHLDGFVGPLFDADARESFWPAGEAELRALDAQVEEDTAGPAVLALQTDLRALDDRHEAELSALAAAHAERRQLRRSRRQQLAPGDGATLNALAQQSRNDTVEERALRARQRAERDTLLARLQVIEQRREATRARRFARSNQLLQLIVDGYQIPNARGQHRSLRALFAPEPPPGGAGDCAAPKLFGYAQQHGLRPIALAEFWWGPPPLTGGRHQGVFYPACRGKCGPVLGHMLDGWPVVAAPEFGSDRVADDEPRTVFEDRWILVVDKPIGLLSVPGRTARLHDSVLTRLQARTGDGVQVVHRLDLDTSGLLLAAKDRDTYVALQRQFAERAIDKRYVALLDGRVRGEAGTIDLALRTDVEDRPRQIHDPVHGKSALTEWRVLERTGGRTRVIFFPRTGRTHQLRVHAAHTLGLGAPIVGDRLYGRADQRLMLHAEALSFTHPQTGARVQLERPANF
jgi:tRNA pseudouridine32 synthase / 23S rRNA pseudouridine746 synthase